MKRREFITLLGGAAAAWPGLVLAQAPIRPLVAVLSPLSAAASARNIEALREGLRELGYSEDRNLAMDFRFADGVPQRLPALVAELVAQGPSAIVAGSLPAIMAAYHATRTIPIIMSAIVQDPMAAGLAASMAQPGGNVSGLWSEGDGGTHGEAARAAQRRDARRIADRRAGPRQRSRSRPDAGRPAGRGAAPRAAAGRLRGAVGRRNRFCLGPRKAGWHAGPLRQPDPVLLCAAGRGRCHRRLPSVSGYGEFATAGVLLSYAANLPDVYRRAAAFVDKVLKGSNIGHLPIERAVRFELTVNLQTAKALELTIPESFLVRADEVIE